MCNIINREFFVQCENDNRNGGYKPSLKEIEEEMKYLVDMLPGKK